MNIDITLISARDRIRPDINEEQVNSLMESIAEVGLLNPITVCQGLINDNGMAIEGYRLIAGLHRLEACRRLGMAEIPAHLVELDDLRRQIAECDENLCGTTLTKSERAIFTHRRKIAWEALHPETRHGGDRKSSRQLGDLNESDNAVRFTKETSARTGRSERDVQRDADRGGKIAENVLAQIKDTHLDRGNYLDELKALPREVQQAKVAYDLSEPPVSRVATTEEEVIEMQFMRLARAWDAAGPESRRRFLEYIDTPVMDAGD